MLMCLIKNCIKDVNTRDLCNSLLDTAVDATVASNVLSDDLDESWVVIDTPIRNSGHQSEDAVSARVNTPVIAFANVKF